MGTFRNTVCVGLDCSRGMECTLQMLAAHCVLKHSSDIVARPGTMLAPALNRQGAAAAAHPHTCFSKGCSSTASCTPLQRLWGSKAHIHRCTHTRTHVDAHTRTHACTRAHTYKPKCARVYTLARTHTYACTQTNTQTKENLHVHISKGKRKKKQHALKAKYGRNGVFGAKQQNWGVLIWIKGGMSTKLLHQRKFCEGF
jgi:hypothetical protein